MIVFAEGEAQVHYVDNWASTIQAIKIVYLTTPFTLLNCYGALFYISSQTDLDDACDNISEWEEM